MTTPDSSSGITTLEELRDAIIEEGIRSVHRTETLPHKIEGCLEGFSIARALPIYPPTTPSTSSTSSTPTSQLRAFEATIEARHRQELALHRSADHRLPADHPDRIASVEAYWRYVCGTAQIDFVYQRLRIVTGDGPEIISGNAFAHIYRLLSPPPPPPPSPSPPPGTNS